MQLIELAWVALLSGVTVIVEPIAWPAYLVSFASFS